MTDYPDLKILQEAADRISGYVHRTPVMTNSYINGLVGAEVFFKCENFQKVGAFKFRGASNAVMSLSEAEASRGVATHSSGNHAAALSLAARNRGVKAYIVMPSDAPKVKVDAVKGYGGEITFCKPTLESRETTASMVVERTGARLVHPYNDYRIIAGQATAAMELISDVKGLDIVVAPVGGGGMLSGCALAVIYMLGGDAIILGAEPANADDAKRSFEAGRLLPVESADTVADGLRTSLGELTFGIIVEHVKGIVTVSEQEIIDAMRMVWQRMKIVIEPSSAVAVAGLMDESLDLRGERVGVILTGGNVDLDSLPWG